MASLKNEPSAREHLVGPSLINNHNDHIAYSSAPYAAHSHSHSHSPSDSQGGSDASPVSATHSLPHGYSHAPATQNESQIHPELRSGLDAAAASSGYPPVPSMMPVGISAPPDQSGAMSGPTTLGAQVVGVVDVGDGGADGRKAKRELSQSKRAAQNRAAQRAFRQRKEGYIKKLEQQVRDYAEMETSYKAMQTENYTLREYVIHLQSRLLDSQGEFPQPPPNINLAHPTSARAPEPVQPAAAQPANSLEVAAQAVAGLSRSEHMQARDHYNKIYEHSARTDDDRTAEEITRQLQADGGPDGLPAAPM